MTSQSVATCLHSCVSCPLEGAYSVGVFAEVFQALYEVLNEMLLHHQTVVLNAIPAFLSAAKHILL